ncbi:MAG: GxxExxY protein [Candidatus Marinimicrobia bacterium]|nr:GxxExxY protein [Candidatus Neomarinimicrobiota bacterium]MDP6755377.1 GxxExxY protein [Candidatus Neomarinimicrobiota bacterium]
MDKNYNQLTQKIIGCAITVHKTLGPGLLESVYEKALYIELKHAELNFEKQKSLPVLYKNESIGDFKIDILVENKIVLELKSVERHDPVFEAQILSYMKLGNYPLGLLINFNSTLLKKGIKRFILN